MQYRGNVLLRPKSDESKKSLVLFYLFTLWLDGSVVSSKICRKFNVLCASIFNFLCLCYRSPLFMISLVLVFRGRFPLLL